MIHGADSTGIFSIAFRDPLHGVIAGGDYKKPNDDGPNLAFTDDGGKTWTLSPLHPLAYFSAVAYDRRANAAAIRESMSQKSGGSSRFRQNGSLLWARILSSNFAPPIIRTGSTGKRR